MIEEKIVNLLKEKKMTVSFAESCTGGLLAATIINVSGSSSVINESYVTYSNEAKERILGVDKKTIEIYTVYSEEVAKEMAIGLKKVSNADFCISVTGMAESEEKSCRYHFAIATPNKIIVKTAYEKGLRNEVRRNQTMHILDELLKEIGSF